MYHCEKFRGVSNGITALRDLKQLKVVGCPRGSRTLPAGLSEIVGLTAELREGW